MWLPGNLVCEITWDASSGTYVKHCCTYTIAFTADRYNFDCVCHIDVLEASDSKSSLLTAQAFACVKIARREGRIPCRSFSVFAQKFCSNLLFTNNLIREIGSLSQYLSGFNTWKTTFWNHASIDRCINKICCCQNWPKENRTWMWLTTTSCRCCHFVQSVFLAQQN